MDDRMIPLSVLREYMPKLKDEDLKELGPVEYDQSKVPEVSKKHAENVRRKVYLPDMTESFARGVEYAGLMSSEAESKATNADILSKDTQNRFKDQIEGTTNSDEVIYARRPFGAENVFQTLGDRLDFFENLDGIYPDKFIGTDIEKVQKAFDMAILTGKSVITHRMYDLTGGTVYVNKGGYNTLPLDILSVGGGFEKYDDGFMFSSNNGRTDNSLSFWMTKFTGDTHTEMIVVDGDCIIGSRFIGIKMHKINRLVYSTKYLQSIRLLNSTHFDSRIDTYLIEAPQAYDVSIGDNQFEAGQGGIYKVYNDETSTSYDNNVVRIKDNVIETRGTSPVVVGTINRFTYEDNYNENNYGINDVQFVDTPNKFEPIGLSVNKNTFFAGDTTGKTAIDMTGLVSTTYPKGIDLRNNYTDKDVLAKVSNSLGTLEIDVTGSSTRGGTLIDGIANVYNAHKLQESGDISLISGFSGYAKYTLKNDGTVIIDMDIFKSNASDDIPSGSNYFQLPEKIRPNKPMFFSANIEKTTATYNHARLWFQQNGFVQAGFVGSGRRITETITYSLN